MHIIHIQRILKSCLGRHQFLVFVDLEYQPKCFRTTGEVSLKNFIASYRKFDL